MERFYKSLISMMVGVVTPGYESEHLARVAGAFGELHAWMQSVEKALYEVGVVWQWMPGEHSLGLRVYGDDDLGVVSRAIGHLLDGYSCRYIGPCEDAWQDPDPANTIVDWDGDTFSRYGWVSLRPLPTMFCEDSGEYVPDYSFLEPIAW